METKITIGKTLVVLNNTTKGFKLNKFIQLENWYMTNLKQGKTKDEFIMKKLLNDMQLIQVIAEEEGQQIYHTKVFKEAILEPLNNIEVTERVKTWDILNAINKDVLFEYVDIYLRKSYTSDVVKFITPILQDHLHEVNEITFEEDGM